MVATCSLLVFSELKMISSEGNLDNFENKSEINSLLPEEILLLHVYHIRGKIMHKVKLLSSAIALVIVDTVAKNICS